MSGMVAKALISVSKKLGEKALIETIRGCGGEFGQELANSFSNEYLKQKLDVIDKKIDNLKIF